jgi:phosphinothricin acetyltransferase
MTASPTLDVRTMTADDWPNVARIYAAGIATGNATFETEPPTWDQFVRTHSPALSLVAINDSGQVVGWAAAGPVSDRCVYGGVAEHSVYVDPDQHGQGIGRSLVHALIDASEREGIWTLQSGVFPENRASLALHEACGFRIVGTRERLGRHRDRWRDVVFIERRSNAL